MLFEAKRDDENSSPKSTECALNVGRSIHVCHLTKYYPPAVGGIETHVQTLARRQVELGLRATVVCVNHERSSTATASEFNSGVEILRVRRRTSFSKWDFCPGLSHLLRRLLGSDSDIDLVHLHTPNPTMTLALTTAGIRKPLVVTHHSDIVKQRVWGRVLTRLERPLMRRANRIFTDSPPYAGGSQALAPWLAKVEALPLGIELGAFIEPSEAALRHRDDFRKKYPGPIWLCVGRLVYYKGIEVAIAALKEVPGTLLIVGDGPLRKSLEETATRFEVAERVVWLGKVDDDQLTGAYHAAMALLFPSNARSEAFGLVQVEAMSSGCPVVNSNIPHSGVPWVCPDGVSGFTVPMNDASALAAAARRLVESPELRSELSAAARRRAVELFDAQTMAETSLRHYQDVIKTCAPLTN